MKMEGEGLSAAAATAAAAAAGPGDDSGRPCFECGRVCGREGYSKSQWKKGMAGKARCKACTESPGASITASAAVAMPGQTAGTAAGKASGGASVGLQDTATAMDMDMDTDTGDGRRTYLLVCAHKHIGFPIPEIESLAGLFGCNIQFASFNATT